PTCGRGQAVVQAQGARSQGTRSPAARGGQSGSRGGQPARTQNGQPRSRRTGGTGSTPVHTSQSGGAAAFSAGTRVGGRRGR
ncbi:hypothetical protein ACFOHP_10380, partial [Couchioplanes caeruleus subsp. azureus]